jgi:hypothetical protein
MMQWFPQSACSNPNPATVVQCLESGCSNCHENTTSNNCKLNGKKYICVWFNVENTNIQTVAKILDVNMLKSLNIRFRFLAN